MVYAQPRICLSYTPMGFWDTNVSSNLGQTTRPSDTQQNKKKKKRELAELWTLPFQLTAGKNEKKGKERWIPRPC